MQLFEFLINVGGHGGIADVGVDLAQRGHSNAHGLEFRMIDVGRNDHAPATDFFAHLLGRKLLAPGYELHLLASYAAPRAVHLRKIAIPALGLAPRQPFCPWLGDRLVPVAAVHWTLRGLRAAGT